jgi:hypothetical protein
MLTKDEARRIAIHRLASLLGAGGSRLICLICEFGPRTVCIKCGMAGTDVRPNWKERGRDIMHERPRPSTMVAKPCSVSPSWTPSGLMAIQPATHP